MKSRLINFFAVLCLINIMTVLMPSQLNAKEVVAKDEHSHIYGKVTEEQTGEPVPYVTVFVKGTNIASLTDAQGQFFLRNVPEGKQNVVVLGIGYFPAAKELVVRANNTEQLDIVLQEDNLAINELVVTSTRTATLRKLAPTIVNVMDSKLLNTTSSATLAQGLQFIPGVRVEDNCQNCGFSQVRINGLDGHYSQILIDSRPIFSALNGVYGLEQIPANMIDRVEVVRGGGSALYGASAVAGTINIITKEPNRNSAEFAHVLTGIGGFKDFDNNTMLNASIVAPNNKASFAVYAQTHNRAGHDFDGDGYTEIPTLNNKVMGMRAAFRLFDGAKLSFDYHSMFEKRRGGDMLDVPEHEANIAESLRHYIDGGGVNFDWISADFAHKVNTYYSFQYTRRESYYGGMGGNSLFNTDSKGNKSIATREEDAEDGSKIQKPNIESLLNYGLAKDLTMVAGAQYVYHTDNLLFMPANITFGAEYNFDKLYNKALEGYELTNNLQNQKVNIFSAYAQNEWVNDQFTILFGARLDKHSMVETPIVSPRLNLRYRPSNHFNFRASYSSGFRAPQIFDEDLHVELVSGEAKPVAINPNLKPERSHSFSGSADLYGAFGPLQGNLLIEGFYTRITDQFTSTDKTINGKEYYWKDNGSGAKIYGLNFEGKLVYKRYFELQGGLTVQKALYDEAVATHEPSKEEIKKFGEDKAVIRKSKYIMRTPNTYGYFVARYRPIPEFVASFSGNYTGSMYVPHDTVDDKYASIYKSPSFFTFDTKLAYTFRLYGVVDLELSAGIKNMFNSYQSNFDKGSSRDSAFIYGPALPRNFFAGLKFSF